MKGVVIFFESRPPNIQKMSVSKVCKDLQQKRYMIYTLCLKSTYQPPQKKLQKNPHSNSGKLPRGFLGNPNSMGFSLAYPSVPRNVEGRDLLAGYHESRKHSIHIIICIDHLYHHNHCSSSSPSQTKSFTLSFFHPNIHIQCKNHHKRSRSSPPNRPRTWSITIFPIFHAGNFHFQMGSLRNESSARVGFEQPRVVGFYQVGPPSPVVNGVIYCLSSWVVEPTHLKKYAQVKLDHFPR